MDIFYYPVAHIFITKLFFDYLESTIFFLVLRQCKPSNILISLVLCKCTMQLNCLLNQAECNFNLHKQCLYFSHIFIIILIFIASYNSGTISAMILFFIKRESAGIASYCLPKMRYYCYCLLLWVDLDILRDNYFLFPFISTIWLPLRDITGW